VDCRFGTWRWHRGINDNEGRGCELPVWHGKMHRAANPQYNCADP
jgi:hypothetical protein